MDKPRPGIKEPNVTAGSMATTAQRSRISSRELTGPRGELIIEHRGRDYRLRITRNGNLILTA